MGKSSTSRKDRMFNTQEEWEAAYSAAYDEIRLLIQLGILTVDSKVMRILAVNVTNAAIRNALDVHDRPDDISNYPGVVVERVTTPKL